MKPARAILFAAIWAAPHPCAVAEQPVATRPAAMEQVDYVRDIKPLLEHKCAACHGALKQEAGLRLDASQLIRKGGDSGPALVPDKPDESLLLERVSAEPAERMPPDGEGTPLKAAEIALLRAWIAQGARSPEREEFIADPRQHWSHLPAKRPTIPHLDNAAGALNPIDSFIAAKHAEFGLTPRPEAAKATLLRRVYVDLIGLPPKREELQAFLADPSPDAYERVADRLLESPQYGQRWGRHWMDVWRYSDWYGSRGINEIRYSQRHIWRWRDWIVDSLNADKGYDRMIVEMLAGDEAAPGDADVLPATGFLGRNWYKFDRNVWMREMVEHTAMGFLAVSLKCARCHDHKFDPISQREYYRFRAFFEPHDFRTDRLSAETDLQKDATLGMVLEDGLARVYDKDLSAATYVFERGDDRYPDKEHPLEPGVIEALGHTSLTIDPVELPAESYFPALRPQIVSGMRDMDAKKIAAAEAEISTADARVAAAERKLQAFNKGEAATPTPAAEVVLRDDFSAERPGVWTPLSGAWEYRDGKLVEAQVGSFLTIVAPQELPRDFRARIRYTHRPEGSIHSVGVAFDVVDRQSWQAIYTYSSSGKSAIQAFHRDNGVEAYPSAGVFPATIEIGSPQTVEIAVRDRQLNVWLNKELKILYQLPLERRRGGFALWTHSGAAEFDEVLIERLPDEFQLATAANERKKPPFEELTDEDLGAELKATQAGRELAARRLSVAEAESASLTARIAAEEARLQQRQDFEALAQAASRAEKQLELKQAESELFEIESQPAPDEKKLAAAKSALEKARQAQQKTSAEYSHLGEIYPRQSTGRRLALARWIADAQNPRTARVAVNHIWERHFGRGLVPSVSEFGMRARPRSHPELLDWLAAELTDHGWSMK
ncbi:MAG TPA: DUF1549 domain-containing protein, partial [Pirellulales bacterium]|nr:DUF1549 domain-containing protein [Pirellulales bacterium]